MAKLLLRKSHLLGKAILQKHERRREELNRELGDVEGSGEDSTLGDSQFNGGKGMVSSVPDEEFLRSSSSSRILRLKGFFSSENQDEDDIKQEVKAFLSSLRFSPVSILACSPSSTSNPQYKGSVFVEFEEEEEAERLEEALVGVSFDQQKLQTQYIEPEAFAKSEY